MFWGRTVGDGEGDFGFWVFGDELDLFDGFGFGFGETDTFDEVCVGVEDIFFEDGGGADVLGYHPIFDFVNIQFPINPIIHITRWYTHFRKNSETPSLPSFSQYCKSKL